jgi:methylmalonyl-CoA/ethylmalonyl-CoA epimerase
VPSPLRRLDHVGIAVRDTEAALRYFCGELGLAIIHTEDRTTPPVRLTYLDAGNAYLQLLEPLAPDSDLARFLRERGEGMHHLCFAVDDVATGAAAISHTTVPPTIGGGRGRESAFVPGPVSHGVALECTAFSYEEDVVARRGWIADAP